jgi:RNA polymerase sigma factor (sigma-70 family)
VKPELAAPERTWTDERLVAECRKGNQDAWSALIEKYKNLIFSVPIKFGLTREDAADIFQAVCLALLSDLHQLREPRALPKWLMQLSFHKCLRWKKQKLILFDDPLDIEGQPEASSEELPEEMMYQFQREQMLRDAVASLAPRCHRMIAMLFFESPARPYQEVAKELGIATGSIGFIRGRCLTLLRKRLQKEGFQ